MNYTTDEVTIIAGVPGSQSTQDGDGSSARFFSINNIAPYYENNQIVGYLLNDRYYYVRYISATPPYTVKTIYNGTIYYIATGSDKSGYTYMTTNAANNSIMQLVGDKNEMSARCILCNVSGTSAISSAIYVKNLLVNGSYIKNEDDGLWNILLIDDGIRLLYYYNDTLTYIAKYGQYSGIASSFGSMIFFSKQSENPNATYYGEDVANLTLSSCQGNSNYPTSQILLPNGTLLESSYSLGEYLSMCSTPFKPYNRSDLSMHIATKSPTSTTYRTSTLSYSTSNTHTKSRTHNDSKSETHSISSSYNKTLSLSQKETASSNNSQSSSISFIHSLSRSYTRFKHHTNTEIYHKQHTRTRSHRLSHSYSSRVSRSHSLQQTITRQNVVKVVTVDRSSVITATVAVSSLVALSSGVGSARTGAFLEIISGQCGSIRTLQWYENPFQTDLVFIGDVGFILLIMIVIILCGYKSEWYINREHRLDKLVDIAVHYKAIDVGFLLWSFFTAPIIVSFAKTYDAWYGILSIVIGIVYYLISLLLLYAMTIDAVSEKVQHTAHSNNWFVKITHETHHWTGVPELLYPIIRSYISKSGLLVDLIILFVVSCSTLIDDCNKLGIVTIVSDLLYCCFVLWKQPIQPLSIAYSNIIFTLGQAIGIILFICGVYDIAGTIIVYISSFIGFFFLLLPVCRVVYDWYTNRNNLNTVDPFGVQLDLELLSLDLIIKSSGHFEQSHTLHI